MINNSNVVKTSHWKPQILNCNWCSCHEFIIFPIMTVACWISFRKSTWRNTSIRFWSSWRCYVFNRTLKEISGKNCVFITKLFINSVFSVFHLFHLLLCAGYRETLLVHIVHINTKKCISSLVFSRPKCQYCSTQKTWAHTHTGRKDIWDDSLDTTTSAGWQILFHKNSTFVSPPTWSLATLSTLKNKKTCQHTCNCCHKDNFIHTYMCVLEQYR